MYKIYISISIFYFIFYILYFIKIKYKIIQKKYNSGAPKYQFNLHFCLFTSRCVMMILLGIPSMFASGAHVYKFQICVVIPNV